jgi:hypothetical protein
MVKLSKHFFVSSILGFSHITVQAFIALCFTVLIYPYLLDPWFGFAFFFGYLAGEYLLIYVAIKIGKLKWVGFILPSILLFLALISLAYGVYWGVSRIKPFFSVKITQHGLEINGYKIPSVIARLTS